MATASVQKHLFMGPLLLHSRFSVAEQDLTISGKHELFQEGKKKERAPLQFYWKKQRFSYPQLVAR